MTLWNLENYATLSHCTVLSLILHSLSLHCTLSLSLSLSIYLSIYLSISHVTGATGDRHRCYRHEVQCEMGRTNGGNGEESPSPLLIYRILCSFYIQSSLVLQCIVYSYLLHCSLCRALPTESIFLSNALAFTSLHFQSQRPNLTQHNLTDLT